MYIEYIHIDTTINNLTDFINQPHSIANNYIGKDNDFLSYKGDTDKTNKERIELMYQGDESFPLLKPNTKLLIRVDESNRDIVSIFGKNQVLEQREYETFFATHLLRLVTDKKYIKSSKYDISSNFTVIEQYPTISVWIWCRALNKILNITNYIHSLSTRVSRNGGNFSIELSPITIMESSTNLIDEYNNNYVNESNIYVNEKRDKRSNFFFHKYIQSNDIVCLYILSF